MYHLFGDNIMNKNMSFKRRPINQWVENEYHCSNIIIIKIFNQKLNEDIETTKQASHICFYNFERATHKLQFGSFLFTYIG